MSNAVEKYKARGLRPKKLFGQNFLTDAHAIDGIASLATASPAVSVLEIGPGLGALTERLLGRAQRVCAIERDRDLVSILNESLADPLQRGVFTLHEGDALSFDWPEVASTMPGPVVLAGNLPYSITGALIEKATHAAHAFARCVFMVQKEVADRLAADPGSTTYGAASVFVQARFSVERAMIVRAGCFHPRPDVDSAVIVMTPLEPPRAVEDDAFREVVRRAFAQRRKTLRNAWKGIFGWPSDVLAERASSAGIDLDLRGETLAVEAFAALAALAPSR
ncbi:MAG: 16S rRNA (adenine(1518)-N(6)/adenine(1519)-N(6))-dimethyltransferase RsmA [Polyangiaceae bacterium]